MAISSICIVLITVVVLGSGAIEERTWALFPPGNRLIRGATPEAIVTPFSPTVGAGMVAIHRPPAHIAEDAAPPRRPAQDDPRLYLVETAVQQHRRRWRGPLSVVGCAGCNVQGAWPISEARLNRSQ
jgi:hypothetical protein